MESKESQMIIWASEVQIVTFKTIINGLGRQTRHRLTKWKKGPRKIKNDVQVWKKVAYEIQSNFPFKYLQKMIDPSAQKGDYKNPDPFN